MVPDSTQLSQTAAILSVNPSWTMVLLVLIVLVFGGLGFLGWQLVKNTKITDGIANHLAARTAEGAVEKIGAVVNEIRADQRESNSERKEQGIRLTSIEARLGRVESDVESLKCGKSDCPNREGC